jgi:hydroxymethylpyrimidine/phosphomethylpyrimidine kinase
MQPVILIIAGFDPTGGAGVLRDILTCSELKWNAAACLTAVTAQSSQKFIRYHPVPPALLTDQLNCIISEFSIRAIKIGMTGTKDNITAVSAWLEKNKSDIPVVVDPLLYSTSGHKLTDDADFSILKKYLFPFASVITPNAAEASLLAGVEIRSAEEAIRAAGKIKETEFPPMLIKGGHLEGELTDILHINGSIIEIRGKDRQAKHIRGKGCMLSTAIACFLGSGKNIPDSCMFAKRFIEEKFFR